MFRWGQRNRQGRGCCVVVPVGCLMSVLLVLLLSGAALARLL